MTVAAPLNLDTIRRASRLAGLLTFFGACAILISIGYSVWRLADTEAKLVSETAALESKKTQVDELIAKEGKLASHVTDLQEQEKSLQAEVAKAVEAKQALDAQVNSIAAKLPAKTDPPRVKPSAISQIGDAVAEKVELDKQIDVLRKEAGFIREELKTKFPDAAPTAELWAKPELRGVMIAVLVKPTSSYKVRPDDASPTGRWYDFQLELDLPDNVTLQKAIRNDIKSVTYEMNHPYLKIAPIVSRQADNNFAIHYKGAGTLRNVVVKIEVAGAGVISLDYDMTKAHPEAAKK